MLESNLMEKLRYAQQEQDYQGWGPIASAVIQSRLGGKVERCHNIPHLGSYTDASHSWGVAMLMWYLWPDDFARLAIYCLSHDVPEGLVGDVPAPTCRYVPGLKQGLTVLETKISHRLGLPAEAELNEEDMAKLKACDRLEFWLWAQEQLEMGNRMVQDGVVEMERYFEEVPLPDRAQHLYETLRERGVRPRWAGAMKELCE